MATHTYRELRTTSLELFFSRQWPWLRLEVSRDQAAEDVSGWPRVGIFIHSFAPLPQGHPLNYRSEARSTHLDEHTRPG